MQTISDIQIGIINSNKSAKVDERFIDTRGRIWIGIDNGTLVVYPTTEQISSRTNPLLLEDRLKAMLALINYIGGSAITKLTGDVTATGPGSAIATLSSTGVGAASYGDASNYPTFTVDLKGRLTAAGTLPLPTSLPPSGAAGGDLSGTYPNPTVLWANGVSSYDTRYVIRDGSNAFGTWGINISGNAGTVTNGVYTSGSYSDPSWITGFAWSKITGTPTTLSGYGITDAVPAGRTLTINGSAYDLSVDRSWSVGTVTNIAASAGTGISISGSPITSSGTITITNTAPDQTVILNAGTGISVSGTYPNFTITNSSPSSGGTVTSVAMTVPGELSVAGSPINTSGTLALSWATQNANLVFAGPSAAPAATPTFRSLVAADLPTIAANKGGTGFTSYAVGDMLSADTTSTLSKIVAVAAGSVLISNGTSTLPSWSTSIGLGTAAAANQAIAHSGSFNGIQFGIVSTNSSSGTAAGMFHRVINDAANVCQIGIMSSGRTGAGLIVASQAQIGSTGSGGLIIYNSTASTSIKFAVEGTATTNEYFRIDNLGARTLNSGTLGINTAAVASSPITSTFSVNANAFSVFGNTSSGATAQSQLRLRNDGTLDAIVGVRSSGFTTAGILKANQAQFIANVTDSVLYGASTSIPSIFIYGGTATSNERFRIDSAGVGVLLQGAPNVALDVNGGVAIRDVTPAQITANQNDYNLGSAANNAYSFFRISSDASRNITGIAAPFQGKIMILANTGSNNIVFTHQDTNSTAANRFLFSTGGNITIAANGSLTVIYDSTTARWRDIAVR